MLNSDLPFPFLGQPFGLLHFLSRAKVLVHIVLPCNTLPVLSDLISLSEFLRPLGIWRDAGLVYMCRDIAANTGICILKPSASLKNVNVETTHQWTLTYHIGILIIDSKIQSR